MAKVNIETSHPRSVGQGVTVTVWREVEAGDDDPGARPAFAKGDTISEPTTLVITVDEDGKASVDEDVWAELQKNGQGESFGFREVAGATKRTRAKAADEANDK